MSLLQNRKNEIYFIYQNHELIVLKNQKKMNIKNVSRPTNWINNYKKQRVPTGTFSDTCYASIKTTEFKNNGITIEHAHENRIFIGTCHNCFFVLKNEKKAPPTIEVYNGETNYLINAVTMEGVGHAKIIGNMKINGLQHCAVLYEPECNTRNTCILLFTLLNDGKLQHRLTTFTCNIGSARGLHRSIYYKVCSLVDNIFYIDSTGALAMCNIDITNEPNIKLRWRKERLFQSIIDDCAEEYWDAQIYCEGANAFPTLCIIRDLDCFSYGNGTKIETFELSLTDYMPDLKSHKIMHINTNSTFDFWAIYENINKTFGFLDNNKIIVNCNNVVYVCHQLTYLWPIELLDSHNNSDQINDKHMNEQVQGETIIMLSCLLTIHNKLIFDALLGDDYELMLVVGYLFSC